MFILNKILFVEEKKLQLLMSGSKFLTKFRYFKYEIKKNYCKQNCTCGSFFVHGRPKNSS